MTASPDGVRLVGPPGVPFGQFSGLSIVGPQTGLAWFGATIATCDLTTGRATVLGQLDVPGLVLGLVAPSSPDGTGLVLSRQINLILSSFSLAAPGTSQLIDQIAFPPGELPDAVALDATTGALWILTVEVPSGRGRLYTLDRLTAPVTATLRSTLVADPADTTVPYVDLANVGQGLVISMAFEPTAQHALRIVGTAGIGTDANLRVNPQTGAVITEEPLVLPALVATATAFTTGPASAGQSRWYVLDQTGQLFTVDPSLRAARPVGGALQAPSPTGVFGFDIAGGDDGLVFAALQRPHEAFSRLYRIELATGRGTEVGHGIATTPLRGLALRVE